MACPRTGAGDVALISSRRDLNKDGCSDREVYKLGQVAYGD